MEFQQYNYACNVKVAYGDERNKYCMAGKSLGYKLSYALFLASISRRS